MASMHTLEYFIVVPLLHPHGEIVHLVDYPPVHREKTVCGEAALAVVDVGDPGFHRNTAVGRGNLTAVEPAVLMLQPDRCESISLLPPPALHGGVLHELEERFEPEGTGR